MKTGRLRLTTVGYEGQTVPYEAPVIAFPTAADKLIIQAPGAGEAKEGAGNRYARLGERLQARGIATLVSFEPPRPDAQFRYPDEPFSYRGASWSRIYVECMAHLVERCLTNAERLCGIRAPAVYLAGFSAGGSVVGAVAPLFAGIRKILLVSTYDSVDWFFLSGVRRYTGEVYVVYGEDDLPATVLALMMPSLAGTARGVHARGVPGCDHFFSGEANSKLFGKAYLWAFAGDDAFPSPDGPSLDGPCSDGGESGTPSPC